MQALFLTFSTLGYPWGMQTGRPSKGQRPAFGQRLHELREAAGLSQQQLAEKLGMSQRAYSHWERRPVALRPDQLQNLTTVLGVSLKTLLADSGNARRVSGPAGKMRQLFEAASKLPRHKQKGIIAVVEDMLVARGVKRPPSRW